jgi:hypothetical protein
VASAGSSRSPEPNRRIMVPGARRPSGL